jgi:hypothetical protein
MPGRRHRAAQCSMGRGGRRGAAPAVGRGLRVTSFQQLVLMIEAKHGVRRPTKPPRRAPVRPDRPRTRRRRRRS